MLVFMSGEFWKNLGSLSRQFAASERCQKFAGDTPAVTVKPLRAVSSVVEHLVYTEYRMIFSNYPT